LFVTIQKNRDKGFVVVVVVELSEYTHQNSLIITLIFEVS